VEIDNLLEEGLIKLGLPQDHIHAVLIKYIEEIELFNPAYGLVKVQDRKELIVKHIFDSLAPLSIFSTLPNKTIADVGSGAGLPGIPLAVCMPNAEFTLIERMGRRAGFLRNVIAVLGLSNIKIDEAEMEKLSGAEVFDLIVFRAFRPLNPDIFKGLKRLLAPGGFIAAYKGRRLSIEEEMKQVMCNLPARGNSGSLSWEVFPLEVPFLKEERHLLLIKQPASL
jgi:16S rRNA (guanine527-N7)-methyltransferase